MGLFNFGGSKPTPKFSEPMDPQWAKPGPKGYFSYIHLDPEEHGLDGTSGVFVIWHGGVRPEWLYVGSSANLSSTLHELGKNSSLMEYESSGNLFVTWALIKKEFQDGVVRYLSDSLKPIISGDGPKKADPIPVITP